MNDTYRTDGTLNMDTCDGWDELTEETDKKKIIKALDDGHVDEADTTAVIVHLNSSIVNWTNLKYRLWMVLRKLAQMKNLHSENT